MQPTLNLDDAQKVMNEAINEMSRLTGFDREKVILEEAGVILKTCASRTPVAKPAQILQRTRVAAVKALGLDRGDVTVNAGIRGPDGRVWARSHGPRGGDRFRMVNGPGGGVIGPRVNYHWTDPDWKKIQARTSDFRSIFNRMQGDARRSAGLARQSWVQIADRLGIHLESVPGGGNISAAQIQTARTATSSRGRHYQNGMGIREKSNDAFFVTLINNLPFGKKLNFDPLLASVIAGRIKYFATSVQLGVFQSMETIAKRYRGFAATNS